MLFASRDASRISPRVWGFGTCERGDAAAATAAVAMRALSMTLSEPNGGGPWTKISSAVCT